MTSISALVIARNESANIAECIKSMQDIADEIIVLDGGSKDDTVNIAESLGARVVHHHEWEGYGKQRQKLQKYATKDWCVWLDADERLTPELREEIRAFTEKAKTNEILNISRANHAFGIRIRHCGYFPDRVLRVHSRTYTTYNDSLVHEKLVLPADAKIIDSKNSMLHYTYDTYLNMQMKQVKYASEWAKNKYTKKGRGCCFLTPFIKGGFSFLRKYIFQLGILDGRIGFLISASTSSYTFNKYLCLYQIAMEKKHESGK